MTNPTPKTSWRLAKLFLLLAALLNSRTLSAQIIPFSFPGSEYLDMARDVASGDLGALPVVGGYANMAIDIASGNFSAIPIAGGYVDMAIDIASGNFSAIPYAGSYLNDFSAGYVGDYDVETYDFSSASPIAQELNFSPEEYATGVNVNLYEMTALYKTQFARSHSLDELYPQDQKSKQNNLKGQFVDYVAKHANPEFGKLNSDQQNKLLVALFWELDKASLDDLKTRGNIVANAVGLSERNARRNNSQSPASAELSDSELIALFRETLDRVKSSPYVDSESLAQLHSQLDYLESRLPLDDAMRERLIDNISLFQKLAAGAPSDANGNPQGGVSYGRSVVAQFVLARYGFELAKHNETREIAEQYLDLAKEKADALLKERSPLQHANWLDNFATLAMINGDAERALTSFQEARAIRQKIGEKLDDSHKTALLAESDERLARFYLAQYRFAEARPHIDACLEARPETPRDSDETRFLRAETLSNRALASFFEGRDYDAQQDLAAANAVFVDVPKYYDSLTEFNKKYPNPESFAKDNSNRYVLINNAWKLISDYQNEKAAAEKKARKLEWAYDKLIANHIRLAQIHARLLQYGAAEEELKASERMKRAAFDYLRKSNGKRVFGDLPLYQSASYFLDKGKGKAFIRDENGNSSWLSEDEFAEREKVWDRIFAFQTVFENNVRASMKLKQREFDDAIALYDRNVETIEENGYGETTSMFETLRLRATAALESRDANRLAAANQDASEARRILALQERKNPQYEGVAATLAGLIALELGKFDDAAKYFSDAESKYREIRAASALWVDLLHGEARLAHAEKRDADAFKLLDEALELTREIRRLVSVDDRDRAVQFAAYYDLYVEKVAWLFDESLSADESRKREIYAEIYDAMESSRAQGFLDIMKRARINLTEDLSSEERESVEVELRRSQEKERLAKRELYLAVNNKESQEEIARLQAKYDEAQALASKAYKDLKAANPAISKFARGNDDFQTVAAFFEAQKTLVCEYMIGEEASFLLAYGRGCDEPILLKLEISDAQAQIFNERGFAVEQGALTGEKLLTIFGTSKSDGLFDFVQARNSAEVEDANHALWEILFPGETLRNALLTTEKGTYALVAPDGVLSQLPFEMLVVDMTGREPSYLLDEETVVFYAPSISVYRRLKEQERADALNATLSVGAPVYGDRSDQTSPVVKLNDLPETENEARRVTEICETQNIAYKRLLKHAATEMNIRKNLDSKSHVHLACHGVVAYKDGGVDCKLAVTAVENGGEDNDGFITLAEFFKLDLADCDCATLSACDANRGETQNGEGAWTLGRGAIVAGAANVVASDWSVDDKSTSTLVSKFFEGFLIDSDDYAVALKKAKREVKNKLAWQDPFYWAPFVLIGTGNRESDGAQ